MCPTATSRRTAALKTGLAALLALATTLIAWRPDWIEAVGLGDPDGGSGMVEAAIVVVLGAATVITATWAWKEWARLMNTNAWHLLSQFLSHPPAFRAVHRRPPRSCSGRVRDATNFR